MLHTLCIYLKLRKHYNKGVISNKMLMNVKIKNIYYENVTYFSSNMIKHVGLSFNFLNQIS